MFMLSLYTLGTTIALPVSAILHQTGMTLTLVCGYLQDSCTEVGLHSEQPRKFAVFIMAGYVLDAADVLWKTF